MASGFCEHLSERTVEVVNRTIGDRGSDINQRMPPANHNYFSWTNIQSIMNGSITKVPKQINTENNWPTVNSHVKSSFEENFKMYMFVTFKIWVSKLSTALITLYQRCELYILTIVTFLNYTLSKCKSFCSSNRRNSVEPLFATPSLALPSFQEKIVVNKVIEGTILLKLVFSD